MLAKKLYDRILPVIVSAINEHLECWKLYFPVCCFDFYSDVLNSLKDHLR